MEFRRRLYGYSPVAVVRFMHHTQTAHVEHLTKLREELVAARAESASLYAEVMMAQARLSQILAHSRDLSRRSVDHLSSSGRPMMAFRERNQRIEAALAAERDRVRAVLQQLNAVQTRFGADIEGVMHRYRDLKQSLRLELPTTENIPEKPTPGPQPDPASFLKKSVAP